MLSFLLLAATCLLAYSNGANDNFKGVASLFGSETTGYKTALVWGTATTFLGSVASLLLARGLLEAFSGKGLIPASVAGGELFLLSVALGAGGTVILATMLGFPISTTHSLVGAIVGAGLLAAAGQIDTGVLVSTFVVPLVASPLVALLMAAFVYRMLRRLRLHLGLQKDDCVCVGQTESVAVQVGGFATMAGGSVAPRVTVQPGHRCESRYAGHCVGIGCQRLLDTGHFISAGVVSFARGLNDTPKIAALLAIVHIVNIEGGLILVGIAMAVGGLLNARKVAITLGQKITGMNHGQGFAANMTTGFLVIWASRLGLPVSTTHVSVGALFGIGLSTGQANVTTVRNVVLSWVITLPCAAALAAIAYRVGQFL